VATEIREVTMSDYQCELCGDTLTSYRAMMECEARCEDEAKVARRNHVSPRVMRPMRDWQED
jgi:hypothetical protein